MTSTPRREPPPGSALPWDTRIMLNNNKEIQDMDAARADPSAASNGQTSAEPAAAFTPGPWQNGIDDLEGIVAPNAPGLGNVICLPPRKNMYSSLEHWPANARLIVAAPMMWEALRDLEELLAEVAPEYRDSTIAANARAAIAKAGGAS